MCIESERGRQRERKERERRKQRERCWTVGGAECEAVGDAKGVISLSRGHVTANAPPRER